MLFNRQRQPLPTCDALRPAHQLVERARELPTEVSGHARRDVTHERRDEQPDDEQQQRRTVDQEAEATRLYPRLPEFRFVAAEQGIDFNPAQRPEDLAVLREMLQVKKK